MHWVAAAVIALVNVCPPLASGAEPFAGIQAPPGFEVVEYAGDELAHDIYSLSIDSRGRVVVAGPGYVRILVDDDQDGVADRALPFADGPANGAQGLFFHGNDLLCVGDAGLLRYRDRDGDDRADGPPDVFLKLKTGGEHDTHSIQQGPDGWWYLISGNFSDVNSRYITLPTSPVKQPEAGVLMRLRPDLRGGEIVCDGMRNAYDFAFGPGGDLFTYDSDDEREISLPWYRPTRVLQMLAGSHLGWVSRGWKRPDGLLDSAPLVASTGRGSPAGVVAYQHQQFPAEYHQALFVCDWTYGRVLAVPLRPREEVWTGSAESFLTGVGGHGFAPTDLEVGPDGSLFVAVGGRGTRGAVYRVSTKLSRTQPVASREPLSTVPSDPALKLAWVLTAPQPLSSWSRQSWRPAAVELGLERIARATIHESFSDLERVRAIEIQTELFGAIQPPQLSKLLKSKSAAVRARALWSYGRSGQALDPSVIEQGLNDPDPRVQRMALEACLTAPPETKLAVLAGPLLNLTAQATRTNRWLAAQVLAKLPESAWQPLYDVAITRGSAAALTWAAADLMRATSIPARLSGRSIEVCLNQIIAPSSTPTDIEYQRDAVRLLTIALGDAGPVAGEPAAFEGYRSQVPLTAHERILDEWRGPLAAAFPTGHEALDEDLGRLLAMLSPAHARLLDKVTERLTDSSDPVTDVHHLLIAARIPVPRTMTQRMRIASALVQLEPKLAAAGRPLDSSWNERIKELYRGLVAQDEILPMVLIDHPQFGRPAHVIYLSELPGPELPRAIAAFVKQIESTPDYPWTQDVAFVIGESPEPAHRALLRQQLGNFAVRGAILITLAGSPDVADRELFLAGLDSSQSEVIDACLKALETLPPASDASEQFALLRSLRRLGADQREYELRDRIAGTLARSTGVNPGFVRGKPGYRPQPDAIKLWSQQIEQLWPAAAAAEKAASGNDWAEFQTLLATVPWNQGRAEQGANVFQQRQCTQCHNGRTALGPDLSGVAQRFSREDLFQAIIVPSRDVSARYQTVIVTTKSGQTHQGLVVYESVDGMLLRNGLNQTFRIEARDIDERSKSPVSLMPAGLLKGCSVQDLADLAAYLQTLTPKSGGDQTADRRADPATE